MVESPDCYTTYVKIKTKRPKIIPYGTLQVTGSSDNNLNEKPQ